jgi:hypothetical protein
LLEFSYFAGRAPEEQNSLRGFYSAAQARQWQADREKWFKKKV